jgi:Flp pilus assembly protein TadD
MRNLFRALALGLVVAVVAPVLAEDQTATEIKKELLPRIRRAQAEGKDLGAAAEEYKQGDEALRNGMQEEALEHFKKAKEAMPADAK